MLTELYANTAENEVEQDKNLRIKCNCYTYILFGTTVIGRDLAPRVSL